MGTKKHKKEKNAALAHSRPGILVNIGNDDPTRGDVAGWTGIARHLAKKMGGRIFYATQRIIHDHYYAPKPHKNYDDLLTDNEYQELLARRLAEDSFIPEIVFGQRCNTTMARLGKGKRNENVFYIEEYNETISERLLERDDMVSHHLTKKDLKKAGKAFDERHPDMKHPVIAVMMADPDEDENTDLSKNIVRLMSHYPQGTIYLCGCRRTDIEDQKDLAQKIRKEIKRQGQRKNLELASYHFSRDPADFNPYKGLIARAKHFVVFGSSQSLLSEALFSGKTVYIADYPLDEQNLVKNGMVCEFNEAAKNQPPFSRTFKPVNVRKEIAKAYLERYKKSCQRAAAHIHQQIKADLQVDVMERGWLNDLVKIERNYHHAATIDGPLRDNKDFARCAAELSPRAIQYFPSIHNNHEICARLMSADKSIFGLLGEEIRNDPDFLLDMFKGRLINDTDLIPANLCDDEEFAVQMLQYDPALFDIFSKRLRENQDFLKRLIERKTIRGKDIPDDLLHDQLTVLKIITFCPDILSRHNPGKDDLNFARLCVAVHAGTYKYFSKSVRSDDTLTDSAVAGNPLNYASAPKKQRQRPGLALSAVRSAAENIEFVPGTMENYEALCMEAIECHGFDAYCRLPDTYAYNHEKSAIALLIKNPGTYWRLSMALQKNYNVLHTALAGNFNATFREIPWHIFKGDNPDDMRLITSMLDRYGYDLCLDLPYHLRSGEDAIHHFISARPKLAERLLRMSHYEDAEFMKRIATIKGLKPQHLERELLNRSTARAIVAVRPSWAKYFGINPKEPFQLPAEKYLTAQMRLALYGDNDNRIPITANPVPIYKNELR
ncbi:MAG: mitochondrial fission ELM1 family protein [Rhodospirillales bacterium]|nr:mitochondrial fission ELM1 family protein [Rhodospirillales bacterium]MCB9996173.1 mitochondrial fission ELM1 family protein [Rhodospirillales bacterium]